METPLISVIVPCYNYGRFLAETIGSLQRQTYANWECIIVDDGSTDDSAEKAKALAAADPRVKYYFQKNAGLSAARNTGLQKASGDFIQFLDADDLLASFKFEQEIGLFEANREIDIVYGDFVLLEDASGKFLRGKLPVIAMREVHPFLDFCRRWEKDFSIPIHSFLFRRSCFAQVTFNTALPTHEDLDVHLRIALAGKKYLAHNDRVAVYRVHAKSMVNDVTRMHRGYLLVLASLNPLDGTFRRAVRWRYTEEVFNTILDKLRGKKCIVRDALAGPAGLNTLGFVFLPVHAVLKFFRTISNRMRGGARREELTQFRISDES